MRAPDALITVVRAFGDVGLLAIAPADEREHEASNELGEHDG
jgi:hypothetical protein